jgi:glycosyltransferase involved in cell wall biosynthesis
MLVNKQLTIVIPCKNEGRGVIDILKLIRKQQLDCQVIIADSSDDEGTLLLLKKHQAVTPMVTRIVPGGLPSVARNIGASYVKTSYVLFLDADIYLNEPNMISKCLAVMIGGDYDLMTCKFKTLDGKYDWVFQIFNVVQLIISKFTPFAVGGFMLFKTETFKSLGGFDVDVKIAEDYRLSKQIKPNKFKIVNKVAYTTSRRFENKGVWYMIKIMLASWWNRNNPEWFKHDHDYWK